MITINEAAARRMGMTVESIEAVMALSGETTMENEVAAWRAALNDSTAPRPTILHTQQAVADYVQMASDMGYSVVRS